MAMVTEMPPSETGETPNQTTEIPPESNAPARNKPGRPPRGSPPRPEPKFFQRVAAVDPADWGTRAFMYVYMDEPLCNPKTFGATRYLLKSSKPILDLEILKQDYGSFKGWMSLNLRKTGKDQTDEVDRYDFEIYDPRYPPKIPKSAWQNDSRNRRWLDLLPPEKPSPSEAAGTMLEAMKMYKEIRTEVKQEVGPEEAPTRTNDVLETMKAAKELFAPEKPEQVAPSADPFETAKKIMDMRQNDPMVAMLLGRMEAMDKAAETARQREYELLKELRQAQTAPAQQPRSLLDQLKELTGLKETLKELGIINGDSASTVTRGKVSAWDFARDVIPQIVNSELFAGIGQKIAASAIQSNPAPNASMSQQQTPAAGPADTGEAAFQRWIRDVVNKQVIRYFIHMRLDGDDLADVLYAMEPDWTKTPADLRAPGVARHEGQGSNSRRLPAHACRMAADRTEWTRSGICDVHPAVLRMETGYRRSCPSGRRHHRYDPGTERGESRSMSEFEDYQEQLEQQEFIKQQGAEAWADAIAKMMGDNMDPDIGLLFREGIKAMMSGPPKMPMPGAPVSPAHVPISTYMCSAADGSVTLYSWPFIANRSSHIVKHPDSHIELYDGREVWLILKDAAAVQFWAWLLAMIPSCTGEEPHA